MRSNCFVQDDLEATFSSQIFKNLKPKSIFFQVIYFKVEKNPHNTQNKPNSSLSFLTKVINTCFELVCFFFSEIQ